MGVANVSDIYINCSVVIARLVGGSKGTTVGTL